MISPKFLAVGSLLFLGSLCILHWTPGVSDVKSPYHSQKTSLPSLSQRPELPSPALQLKQTMTAGRIETDTPALPLIRGDLQQFSDENLDPDLPTNPKVAELQQRLQRLNTLQRRLNSVQ